MATEDASNLLFRVRDLLHERGYKADVREDFNFILTGSGGYKVTIHPSSENIQVNSLFSDKGVSLEKVNRFNSTFRFAKAYLDHEGDLTIVSDMPFEPFAEDASGRLQFILDLFDRSTASLKTVLEAD